MSFSLGGRVRRLALSTSVAAIASLAFGGTAMANGMFVIGNQDASVGSTVNFWGAQWWNNNLLSTDAAPASFKGYVDNPPTGCGQTWTTAPGNSSDPVASLSGTVPMIVSSTITKSGPVISGDTQEIVLVSVNSGYAGDPGHPGTGTVVGVVCPAPTTTPPPVEVS